MAPTLASVQFLCMLKCITTNIILILDLSIWEPIRLGDIHFTISCPKDIIWHHTRPAQTAFTETRKHTHTHMPPIIRSYDRENGQPVGDRTPLWRLLPSQPPNSTTTHASLPPPPPLAKLCRCSQLVCGCLTRLAVTSVTQASVTMGQVCRLQMDKFCWSTDWQQPLFDDENFIFV